MAKKNYGCAGTFSRGFFTSTGTRLGLVGIIFDGWDYCDMELPQKRFVYE